MEYPKNKAPLVVAYGMGVDSTAMLVLLQQRNERPDLILWADTGDEKSATYAYLPTIQAWLASVGFPQVTVVKNPRPNSGDKSLSEACIRTGVLPALAYGMHQCSIVWKIKPQQDYMKAWAPAQDAWLAGADVTVCVGYDAGGRDSCRRYKAEGKAAEGYVNRFPLIDAGWDRERCEIEIAAAGLPVPVKSACFHCPASKKSEIVALRDTDPTLFARAIEMERAAEAYHARHLAKAQAGYLVKKADVLARRAAGEAVKAPKKPRGTLGLGRSFAWSSLVVA